MSAGRTAATGLSTTGLSTEDVQVIRDALAAGRRPKVVFTEAAGQVAGQVGQVVGVTDPASGEDFLVVRFGRDELPFSPADLAIPPRGARQAARVRPADPEFVLDRPQVPAPRKETVVEVATSGVDGAVAGPGVSGRPAARRVARGAKPKGPAGLTVMLAYADGEWTVAAQQGSKALAKPYVIRAAEALKMVGMLDVPGVQEAVEQIVAAERAEAQQQAERLRAELAEVEARLAELS